MPRRVSDPLGSWLRGASDQPRLLVLGWHNVQGTWCFPSGPGRGVRGLHAQLRLLGRTTNPLSLGDALAALRSGRPLPPRAVALTFDDGYADNLDLAAPLLRRLNLPATFFLVPGLLSHTASAWWEVVAWAFRCAAAAPGVQWDGTYFPIASPEQRRDSLVLAGERLKRRGRQQRDDGVQALVALLEPTGPAPGPGLFLDWQGARRLVEQGFDVGSHTMRHDILSEEPATAVVADLAQSRTLLERDLGVSVPLLAYPNGTERDYDDATVAAAQAAGFDFAVTTRDGLNHREVGPYDVRRSVLYPERGPRDLLVSLSQAVRSSHCRGS